MKGALLLGLVLMTGVACATSDFLVWGQSRRQGFVFVGRPEDVRNQCQEWMRAQRFRTVSDLIVRNEQVPLPSVIYAPEACALILERGKDLGSSQATVRVEGNIRRFPFAFAGITTNIVVSCLTYLAQNRITFADAISFAGVETRYPKTLWGVEICGEIASQAKTFPDPLALYYAAGSVANRGYLFQGFKESFLAECKQYLVQNRISRVQDYFLEDFPVTLPQPLMGADICLSISARASLIADINARFTASGRIRDQYFWFVGPAMAFLNGCENWVQQMKIQSTQSLEIEGESLRFHHPQFGPSVCGTILKKAKPLPAAADLWMASGKVKGIAYAFGGPEELISARCQDFLNRRRIRAADQIRCDGNEVRLDKMVGAPKLCEVITRNAVKIEPPYFIYGVDGVVRGNPFWFRGGYENIFNQCSDFVEKFNIGTVNELTLGSVKVPLAETKEGAEICPEIARHARVVEEEGKIFVGGQVNRQGFSIATTRGLSLLECRTKLQSVGVATSVEITVFDKRYPAPAASTEEVCQQILRFPIQLEKYPQVKATGTAVGVPYAFDAPLDEMNKSCVDWVKQNNFTDVEEVTVNGTTIRAPQGKWNRDEVCSAIARQATGL